MRQRFTLKTAVSRTVDSDHANKGAIRQYALHDVGEAQPHMSCLHVGGEFFFCWVRVLSSLFWVKLGFRTAVRFERSYRF